MFISRKLNCAMEYGNSHLICNTHSVCVRVCICMITKLEEKTGERTIIIILNYQTLLWEFGTCEFNVYLLPTNETHIPSLRNVDFDLALSRTMCKFNSQTQKPTLKSY